VFLNIAAKIQNAKGLVILISRESYLIFNPKQKRSKMNFYAIPGLKKDFFINPFMMSEMKQVENRKYKEQ
jgi:hypothetical protein